MPKDFSEFLNDERNSSDYIQKVKQLDPNYITNKAQTNEISQHNFQIFFANSVGTIFTNLLVAPLTTIYTSLQLSVLPHRNKYGDVPQQLDDDMKALIKTKTDLTTSDRRKYELIIKSGVTGTNKPFRAPVYLGYLDVIRALSNQGLLGFFKGYMIGCQHAILNSYMRFSLLQKLDYQWSHLWHQGSQLIRSILLFSTSTAIDLALNPLMLCQSRFILQNRLQNFYLYKSQAAFFQKHQIFSPKEFFKGASGHIYKNLFLFLTTLPTININNEKQRLFINSISTLVIGYPWLTVIRRLQCQSKLPGMIPIRYAGPLHCFNLTLQEEGIRGIYRGFTAFAIANCFINYLMYYNQIHESGTIEF